jgi:transposase-like protein
MRVNKQLPQLAESETVAELPKACSDELAAVEFIEKKRWGDTPCCMHCGSIAVYKMLGKDGERNKRYLWRCHDCKKQFTVRLGTVFEESRLPLRHWCYAFWAACSSKKGVSALQIKRQCQISYKSALFLMHRIRHAMTSEVKMKFSGIVECDETYIGGKPRPKSKFQLAKGGRPKTRHCGRGTPKTPVFAVVERGGRIHRRVVPDVSGATLKGAIRELVDRRSRIMTDEWNSYRGLAAEFPSHERVSHKEHEYARGDAHTNTAESSFAILKRGIIGVYHNVSKKHLPRYLAEFDFRWNTRFSNDGERTVAAIRASEGKRLMYRQPVNPPKPEPKRGEQLPPFEG